MEIKVIHATKDCFDSTERSIAESAKVLAGREAGICYMKDNYFSEKIQNTEQAMKRAEGLIKSGHHSPFDHFSIGLEITGVPKIVAMLLNSTRVYTTSEKSARYTVMQPETELELEIYNWWAEKFKEVIHDRYNEIDEKKVEKLALENARYMLSVFTPTSMGFTASFRQLSYMTGWLVQLENDLTAHPEKYGKSGKFAEKLVVYIRELRHKFEDLVGFELRDKIADRGFKFFDVCDHDGWSCVCDVYSIDYMCSFACLAQLQRHRTIEYTTDFSDIDSAECFVPPIIGKQPKHSELVEKWKEDFNRLSGFYPQCTLVYVTERGAVHDFMDKCCERLCMAAQLETMRNCAGNMERLIYYRDNMSSNVKAYLDKHTVAKHKGTNTKREACSSCLMTNVGCIGHIDNCRRGYTCSNTGGFDSVLDRLI